MDCKISDFNIAIHNNYSAMQRNCENYKFEFQNADLTIDITDKDKEYERACAEDMRKEIKKRKQS